MSLLHIDFIDDKHDDSIFYDTMNYNDASTTTNNENDYNKNDVNNNDKYGINKINCSIYDSNIETESSNNNNNNYIISIDNRNNNDIDDNYNIKKTSTTTTHITNNNSDDVNKIQYERSVTSYKDILFLILFIINNLIIISLALSHGMIALFNRINDSDSSIKINTDGTMSNFHTWGYHNSNNDNNDTLIGMTVGMMLTPSLLLLFNMIIILCISIIISFLWIYLLSIYIKSIISIIILTSVIIPLFFSIIIIIFNYYIYGILLLFLSLLMIIIILYMKPNIEYATIHLSIACKCIIEMNSIFRYSIYILLLQLIYIIIWCISVIGVVTNYDHIMITTTSSFDQCSTYIYSREFIDNYNNLSSTSSLSSIVSSLLTSTTKCNSDHCQVCICDDNTIVSYSSCFTPHVYKWYYVWLVFSLLWTSDVCSNIIHCSTAYAVSIWWKLPSSSSSSSSLPPQHHQTSTTQSTSSSSTTPTTRISPSSSASSINKYIHNQQQQHYVYDGFHRSCTTSLGSICLASLLLTIIKTLRTFFYILTQQSKTLGSTFKTNGSSSNNISGISFISNILSKINYIINIILLKILKLIETIMKYFNKYVLCMIAIHQCNYFTGSKLTINLFLYKKTNILFNDYFFELLFSYTPFLIGFISMIIISLLYRYHIISISSHIYLFIYIYFSFHCSYIISSTILSILSSAVSTINVCYLESPEVLKVSSTYTNKSLYLSIHLKQHCIHNQLFIHIFIYLFVYLSIHQSYSYFHSSIHSNQLTKYYHSPTPAYSYLEISSGAISSTIISLEKD